MNIGYIDYLNCYPLYHNMFSINPIGGIEILPAHPSLLNRMVLDGVLAVSPISAAYYPSLPKSVQVLPDLCIASNGIVRSVTLYSKYPIEELNHRTVGLSSASFTSAIMLKILLKKYYAITPRYVPSSPLPDMAHFDSALTIGNNALGKLNETCSYCYDLGELWKQHTGYASVYALIAVQPVRRSAEQKKIVEVIDSFKASLDYFSSNRKTVIDAAWEKYPDIEFNLDEYYSHLIYSFSQELKDALLFYFEEAASMNLLPPVQNISFHG